jgi:hypothetical protein
MKDGALVWFTKAAWFDGSDNLAFARLHWERFALGKAKAGTTAARSRASPEAREMDNIMI